MRYLEVIYGPIPSWRFGRSLGIDTTTPPKKCTFDCIYCQLGRTNIRVSIPEEVAANLPSVDKIVSNLKQFLTRIDINSIDVVTFSGTGEPTLNLELGKMVDKIRSIVGVIPLVLLTNASLLYRNDIMRGISQLDIITCKFDAGDEETFRAINRPMKNFTIDKIRESIKHLKTKTKGLVALEVMLLRTHFGISNVDGEARQHLIESIIDIDPDLVQLYTPWRPSSEGFAQPVSQNVLNSVADELKESLDPEKLWTYGIHDARGKPVKWKSHKALEVEILEILKRRPCRIVDISAALNISAVAAIKLIGKLKSENHITSKVGKNETYYSYKL